MQQLRFYSPQWLYSTCFGWQSHPSSWVHMLYMDTGKPAHLGCKFLLDVSVVNSPIVVELLVITVLFCVVLRLSPETCRVKPLRRKKTQLLHLVGLISLLYIYIYIYMSYRTANLQMLHFIYYSTNIRTEYYKHAAHSPCFFLFKMPFIS